MSWDDDLRQIPSQLARYAYETPEERAERHDNAWRNATTACMFHADPRPYHARTALR